MGRDPDRRSVGRPPRRGGRSDPRAGRGVAARACGAGGRRRRTTGRWHGTSRNAIPTSRTGWPRRSTSSTAETPGPLDGVFMADAARALARESLDDVVPGESVRRAGLRAAAVAVLLVAVAVAWIDPARRALGRHRGLPDARADRARGDAGQRARGAGPAPRRSARAPASPTWIPEITIAAAQRSRRLAMTPGGDRFRTRFETVPGSFTYSRERRRQARRPSTASRCSRRRGSRASTCRTSSRRTPSSPRATRTTAATSTRRPAPRVRRHGPREQGHASGALVLGDDAACRSWPENAARLAATLPITTRRCVPHRADRPRRPRRAGRHRVLRPRAGRSAAGRPHPPARRRSAGRRRSRR